MYAATSLRDAYRKFRAKSPSFLYAFGQQEFLVFVMDEQQEFLVFVMDDTHGKVSYTISERFDMGSRGR